MAEFPSWLRDLSTPGLRARFGAATLLRARHAVDAQRVGNLQHDEHSVSADVMDGRFTYAVEIAHNGTKLAIDCPCEQERCRHAAAVLIAQLDRLDAAPTSNWRTTLDALIDAADGAAPPRAGRSFSAPGSETAASTATGGGRCLAIRVVRARGSWVSLRILTESDQGWDTRGLSWETLPFDYDNEFRPDQKKALRGILATRANPHHQTLATVSVGDLTADFWSALGQAVDAGVELLDGDDRPVSLTGFDARLRLDDEPDALVLEAQISSAGGRTDGLVTLLGTPAHGVLLEDLDGWLIGGFTQPPGALLRSFLSQNQTLRIPKSDLAQFNRYLPRLRGLGDIDLDAELEMPPAPPVRLVVSFSPSSTPGWAATSSASFHYGDEIEPVAVNAPVAAWRDLATEQELLSRLDDALSNGTHLSPEDLLSRISELEQLEDIEVRLVDGLRRPRVAEHAPVVNLALDDATDWFDLSITVSVGDEQVPLSELLPALEAGAEHLMLPSGTWFSLNSPALDELRRLLAEARGLATDEPGSLRIGLEHASVWDELLALGVVNRQSLRWQRAVTALLADDTLPSLPTPTKLSATLRPYQEAGHAWLDARWHSRLGGILADEMGLGKTLQALALLTGLVERGDIEHPALVVAPASVLGTWKSEAARFAPDLNVVVLTDTGKRRGSDVAQAIAEADLVVTSYTLLRLEADEYADVEFSTVLLDEAQFVKNRQSITYKAVRRLRAHTKFAMTGTPLENNLMDLWSLLSITSPGLFPDPQRFDEVYRKPVEAGDTDALRRLLRRIRPLVLRRTKDQVARELPPKQEQVIHVDLAPAHRRLYDQHLTAVRREVLGLVGDMRANRFAILRSITRLRQLSLAPQLVDPESSVAATKLDVLVDMASETLAEGHRALVFSSFTSFLKLAQTRLEEAGLSSVYLDGATRDRAERIERFRSGDDPLFLISLKAGGFGLTLTEADYVFILDPWWNPAAESQAIDRTHRIGQDKHVFVYRLVSESTIEAKVLAYQQQKRDLFDAVVSDQGNVSAPLTGEDIRNLLDL